MKKTYKATVRSRNRLTVPFDCWMDARTKGDLNLRILGDRYIWTGINGMEGKTMSYRVTVPFAEGTEVELIPVPKDHYIHVKKIGPYEN